MTKDYSFNKQPSSYRKVIRENPRIPSTMTIAMKISTATMDIANAFSHPQSKKCFTRASQIISCIIEARNPVKNAPNTAPTTVPIAIVASESVNLAFSFPTSVLPESHKTGESMMIFKMILITITSRFTITQSPFP